MIAWELQFFCDKDLTENPVKLFSVGVSVYVGWVERQQFCASVTKPLKICVHPR